MTAPTTMTEAERIDAIETQCRKYRRYPETLTDAIIPYLKGADSLEQVRAEWQRTVESKGYIYPIFITLSNGPDLDTLDLRLLDTCIVADGIRTYLSNIMQQSRFDQARDYLLSHGVDEQQMLGYMVDLMSGSVDGQGKPTRLGRRILAYLPERFDELLQIIESQQGHYNVRLFTSFINLLVKAQPPLLDLAWQAVQERELHEPEAPYYSSTLGQCAKLLLQADPARFTAWARKIAGPEGKSNNNSRALALQALMEQDPAQHIDLAVQATHQPFPTERRYNYAQIQITGLQTAIALDPVTYWPLLDEAAVSQNYYLAAQAIKLLAAANFDQARPTLQHCLASGTSVSAMRALELLLKQPWDGQEDYTLSLLAHRFTNIRLRASTWLVAQGQPVVESISPFLTHRSADARLAAVQTLAKIGGERAHALLAARLDPEKSFRVKAALLDAIGIPTIRAAAQDTPALRRAAIVAEAEATLSYLPRPVLAWFDIEEAPTLRWTTGDPVPEAVLRYLLYRQSRVQKKEALEAQVSQALPLIDRGASGDLALALFRGWVSSGAASDESWLLPLVCALADDRLAARMRRQIDTWLRARRTLAVQSVRALALIDDDSGLAELQGLAKEIKHGRMKRVIQEAISVAAKR